MRPRNIRLLTALVVIGVCGWPVWRGIDVIRYEMAGSRPEASHPWFAAPGLASIARENAVTLINDSSDDKEIRKRRDELVEILAVRPLSSLFWLNLAKIRVDAHEDVAKSIEAFDLSAVTGPNEGYIMVQRGMFGIWQWEVLSPEVRNRAIADLMAERIPDPAMVWMRTTLAQKTEQVREEIRLALQTRGFSKSDFDLIGL